jgi:hypothetical protein
MLLSISKLYVESASLKYVVQLMGHTRWRNDRIPVHKMDLWIAFGMARSGMYVKAAGDNNR